MAVTWHNTRAKIGLQPPGNNKATFGSALNPRYASDALDTDVAPCLLISPSLHINHATCPYFQIPTASMLCTLDKVMQMTRTFMSAQELQAAAVMPRDKAEADS